MQQHGQEVETIILGPSLSYHGIRPDLLDHPAFNLANSQQTTRYDWLILAHDSARLTHCHTLIYPLGALIMNFSIEETEGWHRCTYYRNYYGCRDHSLFSKYAWEVCYPLALKAKFLKCYQRHGAIDCDSLGFGTAEKATPDNLRKLTPDWVRKRVESNMQLAPYIDFRNVYVDSIMSFCRRHRIRVLLIDIPYYPAYTEYLRLHYPQYLNKADSLRDILLARYDNITFRSYQDDARFDSLDFANPNHLNHRGAEKLTRILKEDFSL